MNVIIAGSRTFDDYELLKKECDSILADYEDIVIISGCANGADRLGMQYAAEKDYALVLRPADWDKNGKAAGFIRNREMAEVGDMLIVFWDGESHGTRHMIDVAENNDLSIFIVRF